VPERPGIFSGAADYGRADETINKNPLGARRKTDERRRFYCSLRRGAAGLTFPAVRAIVQEIFTALRFAAKPRYMHWMNQAKRERQLRI
jgi:hypothetical protein